ncbi:hypothetical protein ACOME3_010099 [Neoechinorhynchus agilis]
MCIHVRGVTLHNSHVGCIVPLLCSQIHLFRRIHDFAEGLCSHGRSVLEVLRKRPSTETVFCHNDLLAKNIILPPNCSTNQNNHEHFNVHFIDYEYSGYNFAAYDIANHLNEYAGAV